MRPVEPPSLSAPSETLLRGVWGLQSNTGFKRSAWYLGSPVLVCDVYTQDSLWKHCIWAFQSSTCPFSFSSQLFLH